MKKRQKIERLVRHMAASALCAFLTPAASAGLVETVQSYLLERSELAGREAMIEVAEPSAHFPACPSPQPYLPARQGPLMGRVTVGVRCGSGNSVRYLSAHIRVIGQYLELTRPLPPGEQITADAVRVRRGDLSELPGGVVTSVQEVAGLVARHRLAAGTELQSRHLQAPTVIAAGSSVRIESRGRGFQVKSSGRALERGGLGDIIRVRLDYGRIVRARVSGPGEAQIIVTGP